MGPGWVCRATPMNPDPIEIRVLREAGAWKIKYDDVLLEYETHERALAASIELARTLGREGQYSAVVMGMITSFYGPAGFIQTAPNRKAQTARSQADDAPRPPHFETLIDVERGSPAPEMPPEAVKLPPEERRRKITEGKQPRLLRIASALALLDQR